MTREEQIYGEIGDGTFSRPCNPLEGDENYRKGFKDGVKWADLHPNWHKYPDDKPSSTNSYLVYLDDGINCPIRDVYDYDEDRKEFGYLTKGISGQVVWKPIDGCVKAWMELPEEPKFD